MSQWAAAITYFSMLSLFPALLVGVAVLGFFGQQALIADAADYLKSAGAPPETVDAVTAALESAQSQRGTAAGALAIGLLTALYGASGAFGSVTAALNRVWRVEEGRELRRGTSCTTSAGRSCSSCSCSSRAFCCSWAAGWPVTCSASSG